MNLDYRQNYYFLFQNMKILNFLSYLTFNPFFELISIVFFNSPSSKDKLSLFLPIKILFRKMLQKIL